MSATSHMTEEALRAEFVAWVRQKSQHADVTTCTIAGCNCGEYVLERVQDKWEGYKAGRLAAALQQSSPEIVCVGNATQILARQSPLAK
jgi:hypothetical protein